MFNFSFHHHQQIKPLEGLRGIAILLVVVYHLFPYIAICGIGWSGVDLFFVLSGYLITRILLKAKNEENYFRNFYIKRILRIFPLYFLFIFICYLIQSLGKTPSLSALNETLVYLLTYTLNIRFYFIDTIISRFALTHFWSLAVEEHFYFIWPFLVFTLNQKKLLWSSLVLFIGSTVLGVLLLNAHHSWMVVYTFTPTRIGTILVGGIIAVMAESYLHILKRIILPLMIVCGIILIGFFLKMYLQQPYEDYYYLFHPSTIIIKSNGWLLNLLAVFFGTILCLGLSNNWFSKAMTIQPLTFLGKYSYGIYVFHYPFDWFFKDSLLQFFHPMISSHFWLRICTSLVILIITLGISVLSYHLFEKQFLKLKRRFSPSV